MPKPPEEAPDLDGHSMAFQVIGLVVFIMFLMTVLSGTAISDKIGNFVRGEQRDNTEGDLGYIGYFFPAGDLDSGDEVMSKGKTIVRQTPGGEILGYQEARNKGEVVGGPRERFDKEWWRVDFENAPDGWVWKDGITKYTGWFWRR